jgi:hypothetical protein
MKVVFALLRSILVLTLITCCSSLPKSNDFDYGKVENNQYNNTFFAFKVKIPDNWVVQSKDQTDRLTDQGKELMAGNDKKLKAILDASEVNTANLLTVFKYEIGSAVDYNPSVAIIAENVKNYPGIKNGNDYLFQARRLLKQSQIQYDYIDEVFKTQNIGAKEFYMMNASINYMGILIKQIYYSTIIKKFSFSVIISYVTDEQKAELDKLLSSMEFDG